MKKKSQENKKAEVEQNVNQDAEGINTTEKINDSVLPKESQQHEDLQFKKVEKERDEYIDALIRERANFENYKRRNNEAVERAYKDAALDTAAKFFPVLDNIERALAIPDESPIKAGVELVKKQMQDILKNMGIEEIPSSGEEFDPNLHHAVMQVEAGEGEKSGIIKETLQKGYVAKSRVLRHSIVTVTK